MFLSQHPKRSSPRLLICPYGAQGVDFIPHWPPPFGELPGSIFVMIAAAPERAGRGEGETLHLHGTDRGDEWVLMLGVEGLTVGRSHAKADLALRGAVSDLELVLYHRPPVGPVEQFGDDGVLDAWYRVFTFG